MRLHELKIRIPDTYVYHVSYLPDLEKGLKSILTHGLRPSERGYSGSGTYFAYVPEDTYHHTTPEEGTMLRVQWDDLVKLYGLYPEHEEGIQRDNDEIIVPGRVPPELIEVEWNWADSTEWLTLEDAYYKADIKTILKRK